jgi:hypothetical protein
MRIDWSDEADEPGDEHTVRHDRSAPDDPEAITGNAVTGNGLPEVAHTAAGRACAA